MEKNELCNSDILTTPTREYVITRPDTPRSWSNYLGSTEYGAIITNNAGGYSFYKSAAHGPLHAPALQRRSAGPAGPLYLSARPREQGLTGPRRGSRWASRSTIISRSAATAAPTRSFLPNMPASAPRPPTLFRWAEAFECWRVKLTNLGDKSAPAQRLYVCGICGQLVRH